MATPFRFDDRLMSTLVQYYAAHPDYGFVLLDDSRVQAVSDGLLALIGYTRAELEGRQAADLLPAADLTALRGLIRDELRGGRPARFETQCVTARGAPLSCEVEVLPVPDPDQRCHTLMVVVRDLSRQRAAEQRSQDLEARRAAMMAVSLDAAITMASDGSVVDWNPAATRIFGYEEHEALGQPLAELIIPPAQRARHYAGLHAEQSTGETRLAGRRVELTARHKAGNEVPVEMTMAPVWVGGQRYYTAFIHELTTRRATHRRLTEQAQELSLLQDQLPSVFWTTDSDLRLQTAHGGTLAALSVNLADFIGRTIPDILGRTEAAVSGVQAHRAALAGHAGQYMLRLGAVQFEVQVRPFRNEDGAVTGTVALATDVTARHREQQRERHRAEVLESIVQGAPLEEVVRRLLTLIRGPLGEVQVHVALLHDGRLSTVAGSDVPPAVAALLVPGRAPPPVPDGLRVTGQVQCTAREAFTDAPTRTALHHAGVACTWTVPVFGESGALRGLLVLYHPTLAAPPAWMEGILLQAAQLLAVALEREHARTLVRETREETLRALGIALEYRDYETKGHTDRVVALSLALAAHLGLDVGALDDLRRGAYLHDVGKIAIPDQILLKPGKPTPEEWAVIRTHPRIGWEMLQSLPALSPATLEVVLHHHEHWNGDGYPDGLSGQDIPLLARIFAVVDTFDALTSARPYKAAWAEADALAELEVMAGRVLDPALVQAFVALRHAASPPPAVYMAPPVQTR